jgi:hypothetical protein
MKWRFRCFKADVAIRNTSDFISEIGKNYIELFDTGGAEPQ